MILVTIIIPIFNVKHYLDAAVMSSIHQTYRNIEIILVDDGSNDGCSELCDSYLEKDLRIKVIHKENGGLSSARNAGVEIATGDYVMFLDGDDYLHENAVERLVDVLSAYPSDLIQFEYTEVDADEVEASIILSENNNNLIHQAKTTNEFFEHLYAKGGVYASGCTKLYKRELIKHIPFRNIRHEDEMWCTEAFQNNMTITYIPDILYFYVMRDNSIIHSSFNRTKLDSFKIIESRLNVLRLYDLNYYVSIEYSKFFMTVIKLYHGAKVNCDKESMDIIHKKFLNKKKEIAQSNALHGKFKILFYLMSFRFSFVNIYNWYWSVKEKWALKKSNY